MLSLDLNESSYQRKRSKYVQASMQQPQLLLWNDILLDREVYSR
jgi:hypothetical protein